MNFKIRAQDEEGAVLLIVAISMVTLLTLSAGGIMLFTLYGSNREMQKAADQAALAGAAALPPLNPGVLTNNFPVAPGLNTAYTLSDTLGLDIPRVGDPVPDPRAVACAYGTDNLRPQNAGLVGAFGSAPNSPPSTPCALAPWSDVRIRPTVVPNDLAVCVDGLVNNLTTKVTALLQPLQICLPLLGCVPALTQSLLDSILLPVRQLRDDLNKLAPAILTPKMTVEVRSGINPPMLSFITGSAGVQMTTTATAQRHLKNAVLLPETPNLTGPSLNTALGLPRDEVLATIAALNTQLNKLMQDLNVGGGSCTNILGQIESDVGDIYNPPGAGSAPTGEQIVKAATTAAERGVSGVVGEAFLVIGGDDDSRSLKSMVNGLTAEVAAALDTLLSSLQIPILDVAIVPVDHLEDGIIGNDGLIPDTVQARGLFTAKLVK